MTSYAQPLSNAYKRMIKALFKPFDIKKWFLVGFTVFLAGLMDYEGRKGLGSQNGNWDAYDFFNFPKEAMDWVSDNPLWFALILVGIFLLIVLLVVFTWISSRGKFMFLDNVVYDKAEISKPWHEYSNEGNSLFLWRLAYGAIVFAILILYFSVGFSVAYDIYYDNYATGELIFIIAGSAILLLATFIVFAYIECFLDNFVVPIMYKMKINATTGWRRFLQLAGPRMGQFILFGLLKFGLTVAIIILVALAGFMTCCIGFIFLILPYINDVLLLPVSYTFRAFGLEFLEQFGEDYKLFPEITESTNGSASGL